MDKNKDKSETVKRKIVKERTQLLLHRPFFGYLAMGLEPKELSPEELKALPPECRTMATDGKFLYYNPSFVDKLDRNILQTILAHEVLHCALGHLWRQEKREHSKWNYATDYAINLMLKKEKFALSSQVLCDDKFEGLPAETIYRKLPDPKTIKQRLMDSHDKWPKDKRPTDKKDGTPSPDKELEKRWQERLVRAASAARMQGKLPGGADQLIKDLLEPKLDWKIILRNLLVSLAKNDFRLIPPSKKHLWRGIYLPSVYGEKMEIAVGADTSGSVSPKEFQEFLAEIKGITEQFADYTLHLFFCDATIHDRMVLTPQDDWPEAFPKKSGGTDFRPVFNTIEEENLPVSALVYLTDGAGTYPEFSPDYPVIWVLNSDCQVPWGESVKIEKEDADG